MGVALDIASQGLMGEVLFPHPRGQRDGVTGRMPVDALALRRSRRCGAFPITTSRGSDFQRTTDYDTLLLDRSNAGV